MSTGVAGLPRSLEPDAGDRCAHWLEPVHA
jgi:hypothetical protein